MTAWSFHWIPSCVLLAFGKINLTWLFTIYQIFSNQFTLSDFCQKTSGIRLPVKTIRSDGNYINAGNTADEKFMKYEVKFAETESYQILHHLKIVHDYITELLLFTMPVSN